MTVYAVRIERGSSTLFVKRGAISRDSIHLNMKNEYNVPHSQITTFPMMEKHNDLSLESLFFDCPF